MSNATTSVMAYLTTESKCQTLINQAWAKVRQQYSTMKAQEVADYFEAELRSTVEAHYKSLPGAMDYDAGTRSHKWQLNTNYLKYKLRSCATDFRGVKASKSAKRYRSRGQVDVVSSPDTLDITQIYDGPGVVLERLDILMESLCYRLLGHGVRPNEIEQSFTWAMKSAQKKGAA